MNMPPITISIITYDRPVEVKRTIQALRDHLKYSGLLHWHLADDGSPSGYIPDIKAAFPDIEFTVTVTHRKGWGINANTAIRSIASDYIFFCEDDYVARRDINLTHGILLMEKDTNIGLVRYDGLAGHTLNLELREYKQNGIRFDYLNIEHDSPHLNVYSHRPHLKHKRFHEAYGTYPEGLSLADTESGFAHHVKDTPDGPKLTALADGIERAFDHIGKSRQGTSEDQPT